MAAVVMAGLRRTRLLEKLVHVAWYDIKQTKKSINWEIV